MPGLIILFSYLLGSIPFALIVARLNGVGDLLKLGSGNLGTTNVWRQVGGRAAIVVFLADIGKGAVPVLVARMFMEDIALPSGMGDLWLVACGLAAILGHVFPIYIGFRGGKGVATAVGVMLSLLVVPTLVAIAAFIAAVVATRFISVGSLIGSVVLFGVVVIQKYFLSAPIVSIYVYMTAALVLLVWWTHRNNLQRLRNGTENRLSFASHSKQESTGE